jgi:hypothetical protein
MPFRTLEITKPSEIHINLGQLEITQKEKIIIPIEDLYQNNDWTKHSSVYYGFIYFISKKYMCYDIG